MTYKALPLAVAAHMALIEERDAIVERLAAINAALDSVGAVPAKGRARKQTAPRAGQVKLPSQPSLAEVVVEFTRNEPKSVVEILTYLRLRKFPFRTGSPLNEVLAAIESTKALQDRDGKVGPAPPSRGRRAKT